jgi:hypothetical protein
VDVPPSRSYRSDERNVREVKFHLTLQTVENVVLSKGLRRTKTKSFEVVVEAGGRALQQ